MKQPFGSIFLTTFLCGTTCLVPGLAWARGGGGSHSSGSHSGSVHVSGYTRSNGTHVAPYTRSAPGSGSRHSSSSGYGNHPLSELSSGYSSDSIDSEPVPKTSPSPLDSSEGRLVKPSSGVLNSSDKLNLPQTTCGDKPTGNNDTWYPVFIDGGNLDNIRRQFCEDAVSTIREDTKVKTVQLASFNNRDRALNFAQLVGGEVGKPTYPNNVEETTNTKVAHTPRAADTSASTITPSLAPTSFPSPEATIPTPSSQTISSSPALNEDSGKGWMTWIIPLLVLLGIVLKRRKVFRTNNLNSYKTNSDGQQTLPEAAIDAELEALRKQVVNAENKMQSNQLELPNGKKPSTVKETVGQITALIVIGLMFKGCISGFNENAISGANTSGCSQAQAKLERAKERTSEWSQEHSTITQGNFDEATSVAANQASAQNERDQACR